MSKSTGRISKLGWILTILLVGAFIAFLYFLKSVPPGDELDSAKNDANQVLESGISRAKEEAKKEIKKQVSKPSYNFYQLLEDSDVPVPSAKDSHYKSTPKSKVPKYEYTLQVASFRTYEQAESLKVKLILQNLSSSIGKVDVKGTLYYRVMVGPFTDRSKMNKAQDVLANNRLNALVFKKAIAE